MGLPKNVKGWLVFAAMIFALWWAYMNLVKPRLAGK